MPDATDRLQLENTWLDDGRIFALWHPHSRALLQRTRIRLHRELRGKLYRTCAHLKGHGGVKGALRYIARRQPNYRYVARFDVARYYESMRHDLLLDLLEQMGASSQSRAVVKDYLRLPDRRQSGRGMSAGGSLSLFLVAVMLNPPRRIHAPVIAPIRPLLCALYGRLRDHGPEAPPIAPGQSNACTRYWVG